MFTPPPLAIGRFGLRTACLLVVATAASAASARLSVADLGLPRPPAAHAAALAALPARPLFFIENRGQRQRDVLYYGAAGGKDFAFTNDSIRISTFEAADGHAEPAAFPLRSRGLTVDDLRGMRPSTTSPEPRKRVAEMRLVDARPGVRPQGRDTLPTIVSYFKGPRAKWHAGLTTYARIVYPDVWPGIDLEFDGTAAGVGYRFVAQPGADRSRIRLAWSGLAPGETVTPGQLLPKVRPGSSHPGSSTHEDPLAPLQSGSVFAAYAGYFGYDGESDRALGIVTDEAGHAYVTGQILEDGEDAFDAFIAKIKLDGRGLDYLAIIGGDNGDGGFDIDIDKAGNAYITGFTASEENSFPVTVGPDLTMNGVADVLVAKLEPAGKDLVYAGYLGGELIDFGEGIRVDDAGKVYLHGPVLSSAATFPVKVGPDLTFNEESDGFVCKMKADPSAPLVADNLEYCGYIGGDAADIQIGLDGDNSYYSSGHIAIDAAGAAYVSGETTSVEATFPDGNGFGALPGPDHSQGGKWDAYVIKVRPDGSGLAYAGYVGGAGNDWGKGMAVDGRGNAYLTGYTESTETSLPVTVGPDLTFNGGDLDALVAKMKTDGSGFDYLGYLGGDDTDDGEAVVVDAAGRLTIVGYTESTADTFPAKDGPDLSQNDVVDGAGDAYVARIKASPSDPDPKNNLDYAGYIGGAKNDQAFWVDLDGAGDAYVVGDTESDEHSFPGGGGMADLPSWDNTLGGVHDGFVVKVHTGGSTVPTAPPTTVPATPTSTPMPGGKPNTLYLPVGLHSAPLGGGDGTPAATAAGATVSSLDRALPSLRETSYDDFCDFGIGWARSDTADIKAYIVADESLRCFYQMKFLTKDKAYATISNGHRAEGNFALETVFDIVGKGMLAGLVFGVGNDFSVWYAFLVSDSGQYYLVKTTNGQIVALTSGPSGLDPAEPVKLMVTAEGEKLGLYVNDEKVDQLTDNGNHEGRVGLYSEWDGGGTSQENRFDFIRISKIVGSAE